MEPYVNEETPRIENIEIDTDRSSKGDIAVKVTYGMTDIILSSLNPEEPCCR